MWGEKAAGHRWSKDIYGARRQKNDKKVGKYVMGVNRREVFGMHEVVTCLVLFRIHLRWGRDL